MPRPMPAHPERLAARASGRPVKVDREANVLRGYVVAQLGAFKTPGRGQFDSASLDQIVSLYAQSPAGLKARFTHPGLSSDGLGKFLGRSKDAFRDGDKIRADLHLSPSSFNTPHGNLGGYILDLAESDPDALSSSLVLQTEKVYELDDKGRPKKDDHGDDIPPVWRPTVLMASDIVDTGDAVDGLLSAQLSTGDLPDAAVRQATEVLDTLFAGQTRDVTESRCQAFLTRYLAARYGELPRLNPVQLARKLKLQDLR